MQNERIVEPEEGEQLARAHGMLKFFETSAKENTNVDNVFHELASQLKAQYETGNLSENNFDAFRLRYPDTTSIPSRWTSKCCNY